MCILLYTQNCSNSKKTVPRDLGRCKQKQLIRIVGMQPKAPETGTRLQKHEAAARRQEAFSQPVTHLDSHVLLQLRRMPDSELPTCRSITYLLRAAVNHRTWLYKLYNKVLANCHTSQEGTSYAQQCWIKYKAPFHDWFVLEDREHSVAKRLCFDDYTQWISKAIINPLLVD